MIVGYKRVSSVEQKFDRQDLGDIEKVFEENQTKRDMLVFTCIHTATQLVSCEK